MPSNDVVIRRTRPNDDASMVVLIVDALAAATETDPTEMEPLARTVDTDALETLVASGTAVSFEHAGATVSIDEDGVVEAYPVGADPLETDP